MRDSPHYLLKPGDTVTRRGYFGKYTFLEYLKHCGDRWATVRNCDGVLESVPSFELKLVKGTEKC